jgi:uncharacterized protein
MIQVTDNVIDQIVNAIVKEVNPVSVILFGSRAHGDSRTDSDIDLLIIEENSFSEGNARWSEIIRIRRAISFVKHPKDILVFSAAEVDKWKLSMNHVVSRCLAEGKVLYERH